MRSVPTGPPIRLLRVVEFDPYPLVHSRSTAGSGTEHAGPARWWMTGTCPVLHYAGAGLECVSRRRTPAFLQWIHGNSPIVDVASDDLCLRGRIQQSGPKSTAASGYVPERRGSPKSTSPMEQTPFRRQVLPRVWQKATKEALRFDDRYIAPFNRSCATKNPDKSRNSVEGRLLDGRRSSSGLPGGRSRSRRLITAVPAGSTNNVGAFHFKRDSQGIQTWPCRNRSRQDTKIFVTLQRGRVSQFWTPYWAISPFGPFHLRLDRLNEACSSRNYGDKRTCNKRTGPGGGTRRLHQDHGAETVSTDA